MGGKDPKIDAFLNSLQLSGSGKDIDLAFAVPPEMLDMINGVAGGQRHLDATKKPAQK